MKQIPWVGRRRGIRWFYWRAMELVTFLRQISRLMLGPPKPGSAAYDRQVSEEVQHYSRMHLEASLVDARLCEPTPPAWEEIQSRCVERIRAATGNDIIGHAVSRLASRPGARLISLGSGPGGVELAIAREAPQAEYLCLDLNPSILELGREQARLENLPVTFQQADLNTAALPEAAFDVALCYASLHHLIALEHVVEQLRRCLLPGGELIVMDVVTRNGFRMWPETKRVAEAIWKTLPERYRVNHSVPGRPRLDARLWSGDTRRSGMECVRSEEILPLLRNGFHEVTAVPLLSVATRFLNTMYGPNYDLEQPLDRALLDWIWELDVHLLESGQLRPETYFGIYAPR